jgi:hypothetical protein
MRPVLDALEPVLVMTASWSGYLTSFAVTSPATCITMTGWAYADCENLAIQSL